MRLKAGGHDVITAEDGIEGLQKVRQFRPELIVLDVLMPIMDGFTFYQEIKKDTEAKKFPF